MRRILAMLLACAMLMSIVPLAVAEGLALEAPQETVRPGKAIVIAFTVPEAGEADITVANEAGETVSVVATAHAVTAGRNELWWNGTYEGVPAPKGTYVLTLTASGETATAPVSIGDYAPYLTNITPAASTVTADAPFTVDFVTSESGTVAWGVWVDDLWLSLGEAAMQAGQNSVSWDGSADGYPLADGSYAFTLQLTDDTDFASNEEHITVTVAGIAQGADAPVDTTDTPAESADAPAESADTPADATDAPADATDEAGSDLIIEEFIGDTGSDLIVEDYVENDQRQYTPSYGSPYAGQDTSVNYWTLPMDITDEAAVWAMLTAPITVIDGNEKTQVTLRAEPDEDSMAVGVVTRSTQGVHVLETLDNGWSLVEAYSSSFHATKVERWNMLVQGYVKTNTLTTKNPKTEIGIVIDKLTQRLYLFKDGKLFSTLLVSTGLSNERQPYNETRSGEFLLTSAVGQFGSDNLLCSMAIRFNNGDLLHEVPHTVNGDGSKNYKNCEAKLGTKASHGCIRVQRKRTPEGVNMQWLWDNRAKNTKLVIWEDWQGRQISMPDDDLTLYYNPNGGQYYHSAATCYSVKTGVTFDPFTYGQLDEEPFASLEACDYCAPVLRAAEITAINEVYLPGGDHDPILTAARQKTLDKEAASE